MSEIIIRRDEEAVADLVADIMISQLAADPRTVLGVATGSSPMQAYALAGRRARLQGIDLTQVRGFALDEYIGLPDDHPQRYANVVRTWIEPALGLVPGAIAMPDVALDDVMGSGERYEQAISEAGGIDLQVLGVGTTGHIAFNEPGSSLASRTRVKALAADTRHDNARFFSPDEITPTHCVTQGIGTVLEARHLLLIATGGHKAEAVALALEGPITAAHPASAIQLHPRVTAVLDDAAAAQLRHRDYYEYAWQNRDSWSTSQRAGPTSRRHA